MIKKDQLNLLVSQFRMSPLIVRQTISPLKAVSLISVLPLFTAFILLLLLSLNANLSAYSISFYELRSIGRNYMFVVFNGILAYIVKSSNLSSSENGKDRDNDGDQKRKLVQLSEKKVIAESGEQQQWLSLNGEEEEEKEKRRNGFSLLAEADEEGEEVNGIHEKRDEYESERKEEENGLELLSTEELNKRFDEFIRRMKEEIKSEL